MEPFFSVALSAMLLGERPTAPVLLSLIPIVGGVAWASLGELSFSWVGFLSAMGSNLAFQSRNVFSKKVMKSKLYDSINMLSLVTVASALFTVPLALVLEGPVLDPAHLAQLGIRDLQTFALRLLGAAVCFHSYQQVGPLFFIFFLGLQKRGYRVVPVLGLFLRPWSHLLGTATLVNKLDIDLTFLHPLPCKNLLHLYRCRT
jgi:drug/metabolite transporter (DMT)-like permease